MLPPEVGLCRIEKLQFAPESRWEEAVVVEPGGLMTELSAWLDSLRGGRLGFEAFFGMPYDGGRLSAFIGMRLEISDEIRSLIADAAEFFPARWPVSAGGLLAETERRLGLRLFAGEPAFMELGLINRWQSFGGLTFWRRGEGYPSGKFTEALAAAPRYLGNLPAPPAIETAYSAPVPHWFGVSVASPSAEGGYLLDMKAAAAYLKAAAALI
ncbi:hypothetical protein [Cloacibacillus porcorum]